MSPEQRKIGVILSAAALLLFSTLGLAAWLADDPTPLLTPPRPDLGWPLGITGVVLGVIAARWMVGVPFIRERRGRWAFYILFPVYLGCSLPMSGAAAYEAIGFRNAGVRRSVAFLVVETDRYRGRRAGRHRYRAHIANPWGDRFALRIGQDIYGRLRPYRSCVVLTTERARNGAMRVVGQRDWRFECDQPIGSRRAAQPGSASGRAL